MIVARVIVASLYLIFMFLVGAAVTWYAMFGDVPW